MMKVVQCWDDGVVNDIRLAELCRKYNAKATFNLNPGLMAPERKPSRWKTVGEQVWGHNGYSAGKIGLDELVEVLDGFQVASHNWKHEGAGRVPDQVFIQSALDARHYLEDLFQRECLGFAWPGGGYTPETMKLLHEAGFAYARTTRYTDNVTAYEDPMALHSNCHFMDPNFIQKYENAKQFGVFYFWGHSYEMYEYEPLWQQFEDKLNYIAQDKDSEWADVIDIVKKH